MRKYSELIKLPTFEERFNYLKLSGNVGQETFGYDRVFNQMFYTSKEWKDIRKKIIFRDNGNNLGSEEMPIPEGVRIYIHHMEPILLSDIENATQILLDPEYLITTTFEVHNAIHYGIDIPMTGKIIERTPNDMCPWKKGG